jgi:CRISPR/Cas system CMR subunit Cmr6 (Cas7 group RAMP superfamily)
MARLPNSVVAQTSPNLYDAVVSANLSPEETNMVNQMSFAYQEGIKLRKLNKDIAKKEFKNLDKTAQQQLKVLFPDAEYTKADPNIVQSAWNLAFKGGKAVVKGIGSPIVATFAAAEKYGKAIPAVPGSIARATQGNELLSAETASNLFKGSTWSEGYKGKDFYNPNDIAMLEEKYGKTKVLVAKGLAAGKTPGEIIADYGKVDADIADAIATALDKPDEFQPIMDETKLARFSLGRSIIRQVYDEKHPVLSNIWETLVGKPIEIPGTSPEVKAQNEAYKRKLMAKQSGFIDALYSFIGDPLTYTTAGLSKVGEKAPAFIGGAVAKGEAWKNKILSAKTADELTTSIREVFSQPEVRTLWQDQLGPGIKKIAEAEGKAGKAIAIREFQNSFPAYNEQAAISMLARNKVFDAPTAEKFFSDINNTGLLLAGRVDGTTYFRNGVATARRQRQLDGGINAYADRLFNPSTKNVASRDTVEKLEAQSEDAWKIISTLGQEADLGINPNISNLKYIDADIKKTQKFAFKLGMLAGRSPSGGIILYGDDAIKTINNFKNVARLVVPRDMADVLALHFLDSSADQQVVAVRNLYAAYMQQQGLEGTARGRRFIQEVLDKTFNNHSGFNTLAKTEIGSDFTGVISKHAIDTEGGATYLKNRGATQPFQLANAIGALPFEKIAQTRAMTRSWNSIPALFDKATRNPFLAEYTNGWSIFTLFPRLGIRSAVDEAFMYFLSAPADDVVNFAMGQGRAEGKVLGIATGSKAAIGPFKNAFNKLFNRRMELNRSERVKVIEELQQKLSSELGYDVPVETIDHLLIREETGKRAWQAVFEGRSTEEQKYIVSLLKNQPESLNAMARTVSARTSLGGRFDEEFRDIILPDSVITRAFEDAQLKLEKQFRSLPTRELKRVNETYVSLAHFDAFGLRFAHNDVKIADGKYVNPVTAFFGNHALKTQQDFERARVSILKQVGVEFDNADYTAKVFDEKLLNRFISKFGDTVYWRQKGLRPEEIARVYAESMLLDMRTAFHGGANAYNQELVNLVGERYFDIQETARKSGKPVYKAWEKAVAGIEFSDFDKATVGMHPVGDINVRADFLGETGTIEEAWAKVGDTLFEQMDRQVNGIFRQPAVTNTYIELRKVYKNQEAIFAKKQMELLKKANPFDSKIEQKALDIADKRYTEIAHNEAIDTVLKYVDNPAIKTNFAMSIRHVGRFYRATEDFWRRYYRMMREKPLQVIYRMRLLHQGLSASGNVFKDQQGNEYVIFPTDTIINNALEPAMRKLTGDNQFKVPQFNEFKMKLQMMNPSFSPDAGQPSLSGPAGAVSVLAVKGLLGKFGGQPGAKAGEYLNNMALGNIGQSMTLRRAIIPMFAENLFTLTKPAFEIAGTTTDENMTREEVTAAMQAISYMQAYGNFNLPENPTPRERMDAMKAVRISTHNVLFMRAFLGMVSPVTATMQESKGVPDYLKAVGTTSLRSEFYDILAGVQKTYGTDIQDPYALATAMFVAKNPKKTIYLASRTDNNTRVLINKTTQVKDWALSNQKFIDQYGDAAYIFAPKVGDFNPAVYNWMESQDLISQPKLSDYLDKVLVAEDKAAYFDIEHKQQEALAKEWDIGARKNIIANATYQRQLLLNSNPLLVDALQGKNNRPQEELMLNSLESALLDSGTPIPQVTRIKLRSAVNEVKSLMSIANDPDYRALDNFIDIKRERKAQIEAMLDKLKASDLIVSEAYRAVLKPILDFYSRDTYTALGRG